MQIDATQNNYNQNHTTYKQIIAFGISPIIHIPIDLFYSYYTNRIIQLKTPIFRKNVL